MLVCSCRDIRGRYKQLARLIKSEQYEHLMSSLKKEQVLHHRTKELVQYRKNGINKKEGVCICTCTCTTCTCIVVYVHTSL